MLTQSRYKEIQFALAELHQIYNKATYQENRDMLQDNIQDMMELLKEETKKLAKHGITSTVVDQPNGQDQYGHDDGFQEEEEEETKKVKQKPLYFDVKPNKKYKDDKYLDGELGIPRDHLELVAAEEQRQKMIMRKTKVLEHKWGIRRPNRPNPIIPDRELTVKEKMELDFLKNPKKYTKHFKKPKFYANPKKYDINKDLEEYQAPQKLQNTKKKKKKIKWQKIEKYTWKQEGDLIRVFFPLKGIRKSKAKVKCWIGKQSFQLKVFNYKGKFLNFGITKTYKPIWIQRSYWKIKKNKIEIGIKKGKPEEWLLLHNDGYVYHRRRNIIREGEWHPSRAMKMIKELAQGGTPEQKAAIAQSYQMWCAKDRIQRDKQNKQDWQEYNQDIKQEKRALQLQMMRKAKEKAMKEGKKFDELAYLKGNVDLDQETVQRNIERNKHYFSIYNDFEEKEKKKQAEKKKKEEIKKNMDEFSFLKNLKKNKRKKKDELDFLKGLAKKSKKPKQKIQTEVLKDQIGKMKIEKKKVKKKEMSDEEEELQIKDESDEEIDPEEVRKTLFNFSQMVNEQYNQNQSGQSESQSETDDVGDMQEIDQNMDTDQSDDETETVTVDDCD